MTRAAGIDVSEGHVRVAVLRAAYRKVELEALLEEPIANHESEEAALSACFQKIGAIDVACSTISGAQAFVHRLSVPSSAAKRLREVLPFELEAELPIDIDEVVFDYEVLQSPEKTADQTVSIVSVAARQEVVKREIEWLKSATRNEPERIGVSHLELAQLSRLSSGLSQAPPTAIVNLGSETTDLCLSVRGMAEAGRTLSLGANQFPERAERLIAGLRQSLAGFATQSGQAVEQILLCGEGARMSGMDEFLSSRLQLKVETLGVLDVEGLDDLDRARVSQFALSLATAAHGLRRSGFDLRKGPLAFERGYGFLKEQAPLLAGLFVAVFLSFLFSTWAEGRALESEHEALTKSLEQITRETFGTPIADPDEAETELANSRKSKPEDPMPYLDGFGVAVALAETIPPGIEHDVELFDYAKGKLMMRGVVSSTEEAQQVAKSLGEHRCIHEPNISKISQVVNSERERYVMEASVRCPEDETDEDKKKGGRK